MAAVRRLAWNSARRDLSASHCSNGDAVFGLARLSDGISDNSQLVPDEHENTLTVQQMRLI